MKDLTISAIPCRCGDPICKDHMLSHARHGRMSEDEANRIMHCVNLCAGFTNEEITERLSDDQPKINYAGDPGDFKDGEGN